MSWASREVLIKVVAQAIPTYAMSVFKLPTNLCNAIQSTINRFWWGYSTEKKKIHWVNSEVLCTNKNMGGLGFREMEAFNNALLAKQFWRMAKSDNTLVVSLLKARYFPDCNIFEAGLGSHPSFTWRSILSARDLVVKGSRWLIGDGATLDIWNSGWLSRPFTFAPYTPKPHDGSITKVSDLIDYEQAKWKDGLIRELFLQGDADTILGIPLCRSWPRNKLIWHYTSDNYFTVKFAYQLRLSQRLSAQGSSSNPQTDIWKTIWRLDIPSRIRVFTWRLCQGALPTHANIASRIPNHNMCCAICGDLCESEPHILLYCPLAILEWF